MQFKVTSTGALQVPGKVYYFRPSSLDQFDRYSLALGNLDKETVTYFKNNGLKVYHEPDHEERKDWGYYHRSSSQFPIKCKDVQRNDLPEDLQYGNGTEVIALLKPREIGDKQKKNHKHSFVTNVSLVVVTKLIEYEGSAGIFEGLEGGYVHTSSPNKDHKETAQQMQKPLSDTLDDDIDF